jgi:phage FluMu protein Com
VLLIELFKTRCPACKRWLGRTVVREVASSWEQRSSEEGGYVEHGTRTCRCKHCGHQWSQSYSSTSRS